MFPVRVLVADDHEVVRLGLKTMLEDEPDMELVGEATDGAEAVVLAAEVLPDVVIMDIRMPRMGGVEATRRIKRLLPQTAVIIMTVFQDDAHVIEAIQAGAAGYLLKDSPREMLVSAVKDASAGGPVLKSDLLRRVLAGVRPQQSRPTGEPPDAAPLSNRELEVLGLVAEGLTNRQIGDRLSLAEDTVKKHVQSIIAKLQASDRTQAAVKGVRMGIIPCIEE